MTYHYTESGLDNVYLGNGYEVHETPYGKGVSIQDTEGLHRVIGAWLISLPTPLNGAELRFLRLEMDMTQKNLAGIIGTTEQSLRLWEKGREKAIPGTADRLLRAIYSEFSTGDGSVRRLVERLGELDQMARASVCLRETPRGWELEQPTIAC
jgi:putative transcriptional regulator